MNENNILLYHSGELDEGSRRQVELELSKEENSELRDFYETLQEQEAFFETAVPEMEKEGMSPPLNLDFILKSGLEGAQDDQQEKKLIQWRPIITIVAGLAIAACFVVIFNPETHSNEQDVIAKVEINSGHVDEKTPALSKYLEFKKRREINEEVSEIIRGRGTQRVLNPRKSLARF